MVVEAAFAQDPAPSGPSRTASVLLNRINISLPFGPLGNIYSTADSFLALFLLTDGGAAPTPPDPITIGQCVVTPSRQLPEVINLPTILDAGPVMNVTGPNGTRPFAATQFGFAGALGGGPALGGQPPPVPLYLDPGDYTVDNGAGGADVGPFTATITIPDAVVWTNADTAQSLSINRAVGVDVTWTGGDPNSTVQIRGGVLMTDPATLRVSGGATFVCTADNSAGHFFVSPDVLSRLPASSMRTGISNGLLSVGATVVAPLNAPGIDAGNLSHSVATIRNPGYY